MNEPKRTIRVPTEFVNLIPAYAERAGVTPQVFLQAVMETGAKVVLETIGNNPAKMAEVVANARDIAEGL